jgi:tRNA(His) 5'-end guanylyltransferase
LSIEHEKGDFSIIRLDGKDFHRIAEDAGLKRPFDREFAVCFVNAGKTVFDNKVKPRFAYLVSDEINFVYSEESILDRLDSIGRTLSEQVSNVFSNMIAYLPREQISDFDWNAFRTDRTGLLLYLTERQEWAYLNFLRAYAFWVKISSGLTSIQARTNLQNLDSPALKDLILSAGISLDTLPLWQHRGIIIRLERRSISFEKKLSDRYGFIVDFKPASFKSREGKLYLLDLLGR